MNNLKNKSLGFTLIELLIVIAITAIIAALAFPSYAEYIKRGNRTEGQAMLNEGAAAQERFNAQNYTYITTQLKIASLKVRSSTSVGVTSDTGKYTLNVSTAVGDGGYTLTAVNTFNDTLCGNLTLTATGLRGITGTGTVTECWR
jgi:type IV pilus assembly protein PilE